MMWNKGITKFKPEYCKMLIEHMAKGYSFATFAPIIKASRKTLYNWARDIPEFAEAKKAAFDECLLFWERQGIENINNRDFNTVLWKLNVQARFRKDWAPNEQKLNIEARIKGDVQKLSDMSDAEVIRIGKEAVQFLEADYEESNQEAVADSEG